MFDFFVHIPLEHDTYTMVFCYIFSTTNMYLNLCLSLSPTHRGYLQRWDIHVFCYIFSTTNSTHLSNYSPCKHLGSCNDDSRILNIQKTKEEEKQDKNSRSSLVLHLSSLAISRSDSGKTVSSVKTG